MAHLINMPNKTPHPSAGVSPLPMGHACLLSIQSVLCPEQIPLLLFFVLLPFSLVLYLFVFVLVLALCFSSVPRSWSWALSPYLSFHERHGDWEAAGSKDAAPRGTMSVTAVSNVQTCPLIKRKGTAHKHTAADRRKAVLGSTQASTAQGANFQRGTPSAPLTTRFS